SVTMTLKAPGDASYPTPATAQAASCGTVAPGLAMPPAVVTPNTSSSYGAAWIGGCWVQDTGGTISAQALGGNFAAIDAGYDATNASAGTDAVVLLGGSGGRGPLKLAASQTGMPVFISNQTVAAAPGTASTSGGPGVTGFSAADVKQTTFGPAGQADIASATDVGGAASDDGGATFRVATYDLSWSAAWWQGASGTWLLFGLVGNPQQPSDNTVSGFENWTDSTPPIGTASGSGTSDGNVTGSTGADLGIPGGPTVYPTVRAIAGVPGQDATFLDVASGNNENAAATAAVSRASIGPGPSFTSVTPIGAGVITKAGKLSYCPTTGSAGSLQDVLLVTANDSTGGAIYRVTGATGPGPTVTKVADLPGVAGPGIPALRADCASGTVLAAAGAAMTGSQPVGGALLESTDGGQTFTNVTLATHDVIRAVTLIPANAAGTPPGMLVADAGGYIYSSGDSGQTWTVVNDPATGENLGGVNASGGIWDLAAPPATAAASADLAVAHPFAEIAAGADLVAGPGEFQGKLAVPGKAASTHALTVTDTGNGAGTVTSQPVGISCTKTCSHGFAAGTAVTLTAKPASGSAFTGWGGSCSGTRTCTVLMSADRTVSATFRLTVTVSAFSLTNTRFAITSKPTAISARAATTKRGTTFRYTLSAAATTTILIERKGTGRLVRGKCVAQTKRTTHLKRCTLFVKAGTLTRKARKGMNTLAFSGRIGRKALTPGTYRASITARISTGPVSRPRTATFTILTG
ncbi:MAG TPA: hypothetical protein VMD51_15525, partial [Mycobacterium sp.]|nr:hypothetical protein [Mycobacterium sp.]